MYPFWEMVVAPLVKASGARRVLEIGALRGETTAKMFEQLGRRSELHVIDPLPQFDPLEHEERFPGRYVFHRALSLDVLPDLPAFDVALIDGDHNWYTVFHELQHLAATARKAKQDLPILVLHDVGWPYGHRDLYYEPSQIPEEFRQPHQRAGMAPGYIRLLAEGGLNADLHNAIEGGGPRNGVRCALDDFLAAHDRPVRVVTLPFYYGLAIVVEEARLQRTPELGTLLDGFESAPGRERLLKLSERIRIDASVHEHNWNRNLEQRADAHRDRYLRLLKAALLDQHYLDNEVRLDYLTGLPAGAAPDLQGLRDPARTLEVRYKRLAQGREVGRPVEGRGGFHAPYAGISRDALDHLEAAVADVGARDVAGDLVECGVGRGGGSILMRACLDAYDLDGRQVWLVDPFLASEGARAPDAPPLRPGQGADLNQVRDGFARFDLFDDRVRFVPGDLVATVADAPFGPVAVLRVGIEASTQIGIVLSGLLAHVEVGGTVIVEGIGKPVIRERLDAFRAARGITDPVEQVDWNTVSWRVSQPAGRGDRSGAGTAEPRSIHRVPLPRPVATEPLDLSVVVVFYDMAREAPRTLHSLSRAYQRGIEDVAYEVLVVDNGSHPEHRLTPEQVAAHGPEFRLITLTDAPSSPTVALNHGIDASSGRAVAVMIDGAHVLTPGVFRHALAAMATYEPAVVAIQQWYLGPGQQGDAQQAGYDQSAEDKLLENVRWPTDGYRLFEIGHFIGDRDWFDGIIESNCLFAPRAVLEQVGGFDDSFDMAGGGYANLELFERLHNHPGVTPTSVLGEGSFHQFHGGTTTNVADEAVRRARIVSYAEHFRETRGRPLTGLNKAIHYVGAMDTKAARRTRSRREFLLAFDAARDPVRTTGSVALPVPEELKFAAIEALWQQQAWRGATWLGHRVARFPTDLHSYQELVGDVRPAAVVLVGDDDALGGRALFFASILDQLGAGRVVAVGPAGVAERVAHDRITYVDGRGEDADVIAAVGKELDGAGALVFLALGASERVLRGFAGYQAFVPEGSYVVVENTVVNGRPVEPGFGPGPHEAVNALLQLHPDFVPDVAFERYTVTFNKNGFLRRTAPR